MNDKLNINLWTRRGKDTSSKKKSLLAYIKDEEWADVIGAAVAVANYYGVDITHIINE
ncbi:hypothetical protein [Clostridium sp. HMP27]|uniref:hypothetical protein n=1 Tax=Clostridium sp. HMP27 TaxID=1487921 RepID=UPI000AA4FAB3|nr:hypothetical protein [Clostridium sp. HMP27]